MGVIKSYNVSKKYGRLRLIRETKLIVKGGTLRRHGLFQCDCGNKSIKILGAVMRGEIKSCGKCMLERYSIKQGFGKENTCYRHGMFGTRFYNIYYGIVHRCRDPKNRFYHQKGIKCQWSSFISFRNDMYESYLRHYKKFGERQTTIDRIDSSKDYCKENCQWATYKEQAKEKRRKK